MIDAFTEVLGPNGTLVVPTYTYSIGRGEVYEVETTAGTIGEFSEVFRKRPNVIRSRDPMTSAAAAGPKAATVLRTISRSCFGEGSTFHRLREVNARICMLGLGLHWATFVHHIEEVAKVPFRFSKSFTGIVREQGVDAEETWSYFAAPTIENCRSNSLALERRAREEGLLQIATVGRGEIVAIDATSYLEFGLEELRRDPWLTAKGPPAEPQYLFKDEPQWWAAHSTKGATA